MNRRLSRQVGDLTRQIEDLNGVNDLKVFIHRGRADFHKYSPATAHYKNAHHIVIVKAKSKSDIEVDPNDSQYVQYVQYVN